MILNCQHNAQNNFGWKLIESAFLSWLEWVYNLTAFMLIVWKALEKKQNKCLVFKKQNVTFFAMAKIYKNKI